MKNKIKKIILVIVIILVVCLLDSIIAMIFDTSPLIKIRVYYNGGDLNYVDKGIFVNTYCGTNGIKDTTIKGFSYSLSYDSDYEIIDTSKEIENFACEQQLEEIFEDANYIYYLPCMKSQYIEVRYSNGNKENIIAALGQGHIDISVLDKFNIEYIKKEKTMMWKLENDQEVIKNVNSNVIKEELSKADNLEIAYLTLTPPKNIKDTRFIQTYNDINVGNPKNENEKFHIEICVNDKEKEFKLMAKDNLTKEEIEKIFIDYFENNIVPDISEWYEL